MLERVMEEAWKEGEAKYKGKIENTGEDSYLLLF